MHSVQPVPRVLPTAVYPDLAVRRMEVDVGYINACVGVDLAAAQIADLLSRMALFATPSPDGRSVAVAVPPTRSDVLHACDVMEVGNFSTSCSTCSARNLGRQLSWAQHSATAHAPILHSCETNLLSGVSLPLCIATTNWRVSCTPVK